MSGKAKFGIASTLIFVAIAAAPALVCLSYLAQSTDTHSCCPQEKPQNTVVPGCCVYSPAVTSPSVDARAPMIGAATFIEIDPTNFTSDVERVQVHKLDTSPPACSSILRI
jgi:hypothetical protein